jgi:heme/copper-type cytochrome/quinol oxidase subunit 3
MMTAPPQRQAPLADGVLAMLVFVTTEAMFFTALISAFVIIKSGVDSWSPPPGVRLPVMATAFNTALLLLSAVALSQAGRCFAAGGHTARRQWWWLGATGLGALFVLLQGFEWLRLIDYGMTMTSGIFGACFFLLVGTHGIHAAAAVIAMAYLLVRLQRQRLRLEQVRAMQIFWYFVVGIWPMLCGLVYF